MKYALAILWIVLAFALQLHPIGRRVAAYLGSVLALVHASAFAGGLLFQKVSRDGVPSLYGFFGGILAGLVLGLILGEPAFRYPILFWIIQIAVAGFLAFLPLF